MQGRAFKSCFCAFLAVERAFKLSSCCLLGSGKVSLSAHCSATDLACVFLLQFQDEMEDEDSAAEGRPNFNTPQVLRFEEPLANLLNEQHRTVKEQLEQLRMKKSAAKLPQEAERLKLREKPVQTLVLDAGGLPQIQMGHVQLLTQAYLLSSCNPSLSCEASTTRALSGKEFGSSRTVPTSPSRPPSTL
uniref:Uncharacterized protein n=1 Tax=Podarcis muralis TaxID=64176 RepID=A0A670K2V9_PODMU